MNKIPELIENIKAGRMVILVDDEDRENEGDLILAANHATPENINFMAKEARGLICLAMKAQQIRRLGLPLMVKDDLNLSPNRTAFTVSIEASEGVTTGISAADRAHTIRVASDPQARSKDVITPGHVFPIQAQEGGVLRRAGHTEASVDLCELAGLESSAVICEIMNDDGTMARVPELKVFAKKHGLLIGSIEDLIKYRIQTETYVEEVARAQLPSSLGSGFEVRAFKNKLDGREHIALVKGEIDPERPVLVRVHSECLMGDVFGSLRTRSGEYLHAAIQKINEEGSGVVVYLRLEDMGDRLINRIKSYQAVDSGARATEQLKKIFRSDDRDYGLGAQILRAIGVRKMRLLTNSPQKKVGLRGYGMEVTESLSLPVDSDPLGSVHYCSPKDEGAKA